MKSLHYFTKTMVALALIAATSVALAAPGDGKGGGKKGDGGGGSRQDGGRGNQGGPKVQVPSAPKIQNAPQAPQVQQAPKVQVAPQGPKVQVAPQGPKVQVAPQTPNVQVAPQAPKVQVAPQTPKVQVAPQTPKVQVAPQAPNVQVAPQTPNNSAANQLRGPRGQNPGNPGNQPRNPLGQPRSNVVNPPAVGGNTPSLPNVTQPNATQLPGNALPSNQLRNNGNRNNIAVDPNRANPDLRNRINNEIQNRVNPDGRGTNNLNNALGNNNRGDDGRGGRNSDFRPNYPNHSWYQGHWKAGSRGPGDQQIAGYQRNNNNFNNRNFSYNPGGYSGYGYNGYGVGGNRSGLGSLLGIGLALSGYGNGGQFGYGGYGGYGNYYGRGYGGYGLVGGYPVGWGYGGYGLGRIAYTSGYFPYVNPYYVQGGGYNYSRPIQVVVAPNAAPTDSQLFDAAVAQFKNGDYKTSLTTIDAAIEKNSTDPAMHEFRSLVLFALGDYRNSASTIHSVLAVGPGWNWATLSSLYDDIGVYEQQFRALETASQNNPDQADLRFLLAYHYLATETNQEEAVAQLRKVVQLAPNDRLSADLLKMNEVTQTAQPAPQAQPSNPIAQPKAVDPAALVGQWTAQRPDNSKFEFRLAADKTFTWKVDQQGQTETLNGTYDVEKDLLALESDKAGGMVGHVSVDGNDQFNFKLLGAPQDDEGLTFKKQ